MSINNQFDLLTLKETASQLNISISTIRRLIKNKKIKAIKVGGGIRISKNEISNFLSQDNENYLKNESQSLNQINYPLNVKKNIKTHYVIPGVNSIEAETLESIISDNISQEEIIDFLKEEKYNKLLKILENVVKKYNLDIRKSLILFFIEEAINNLYTKKEILINLAIKDKALLILPFPSHLFFYFFEFLSYGQIINSEDKISPHLDPYKKFIINIDQIDPLVLHEKFSKTKIILIDGFKTKNGYLIRRSVANLIIQYLQTIEKIYIHNIPHLPKDQKFSLIKNQLIQNKVIDI